MLFTINFSCVNLLKFFIYFFTGIKPLSFRSLKYKILKSLELKTIQIGSDTFKVGLKLNLSFKTQLLSLVQCFVTITEFITPLYNTNTQLIFNI